MKKDEVLSEEQAVKEMQVLCQNYEEKSYDYDKILERYPDAVNALKRGNLVIKEDLSLEYKLREAVKGTDTGEVYHDVLKLKTRIKPKTQEELAKGISVSKEQVKYLNRCICYVGGLEPAIFNELNKFDQKALEQLTVLFM